MGTPVTWKFPDRTGREMCTSARRVVLASGASQPNTDVHERDRPLGAFSPHEFLYVHGSSIDLLPNAVGAQLNPARHPTGPLTWLRKTASTSNKRA